MLVEDGSRRDRHRVVIPQPHPRVRGRQACQVQRPAAQEDAGTGLAVDDEGLEAQRRGAGRGLELQPVVDELAGGIRAGALADQQQP